MINPIHLIALFFLGCLISCTSIDSIDESNSINRFSLVNRNNVKLTEVDTLGSLSVGNGEFAFTVDVTGMQTFPEAYENGIPLATQSQWGWHSFPNKGDYVLEDVLVDYESCNDKSYTVAIQHKSGRAKEATDWLRVNPHRLHLGLIGLVLLKSDGTEAKIEDIQQINQELNLWKGKITSEFTVEGVPVKVELYSHQDQDMIGFRIESELINTGRLKVKFRFPYGKNCHVCPGYDWESPDAHTTELMNQEAGKIELKRILDRTEYFVQIGFDEGSRFEKVASHHYELIPSNSGSTMEGVVAFRQEETAALPKVAEVSENSESSWEEFWMTGGAIDFSACTAPQAKELERRVVLSQYLTKINCAGSYPPQETGLTSNSWYGKFHLEMHWWHGVHFALWDRIDLLSKSMNWYNEIIGVGRGIAERQGFDGVRWPKMTAIPGHSSPSGVGEFLVWQQPHPIYFAELFYEADPSQETLERFKDIVFETADFMASFAQLDEKDGLYHLCAPLIPAQEIFHATETNDPPFELAYWHYALNVAQQWKERLGLPRNDHWQIVIEQLAPLPRLDSLYLPCAKAYEAYTDPDNRRDHPVVTGAYGMLPWSPMIDTSIMMHTFENIMQDWNWETTWGWDYPMLAMTAARLGRPEMAIEALFMDAQKNTYLVNGHNYQDQRLRLYLPGNGGLLTAVAMMAGGWKDAPNQNAPGFPKNGEWDVKWEGLKVMP